MIIKEFLRVNTLRATEERLGKLIAMEAPKVIIEGTQKQVEELKTGKFEVGGDATLLDLEFSSFEQKKGRGGKIYVKFDNGVKYFPQAQYGRYISR